MKKQVAQFVPYTDTLGVKKDTTGMSPVAVGDDGKLYTESYNSVIDDFYITSSYGSIVLHMKDGSTLSDYKDPRFFGTITNKKYYGKFAKAIITYDYTGEATECETLLQMVYTDGEVFCGWNGQLMYNDPEYETSANPVPVNFGFYTGLNAGDLAVKCSNYSGV